MKDIEELIKFSIQLMRLTDMISYQRSPQLQTKDSSEKYIA